MPFCHLGLLSEPKWGHLKDLHAAIRLCEPALVAADLPRYMKLGPKQEVCAKRGFFFFSYLTSCCTVLCQLNI